MALCLVANYRNAVQVIRSKKCRYIFDEMNKKHKFRYI